MEITWKLVSLCSSVLFFQLCNGFPINLENATAGESSRRIVNVLALAYSTITFIFVRIKHPLHFQAIIFPYKVLSFYND